MNVRVSLRAVPGRSILYSAIAAGVISDGRMLQIFTKDPDCEYAAVVDFRLADVSLIELDEEGACLA